MCDLGTKGEVEIKRKTLAYVSILSFMRTDYWVPGVDLVSQS